MESIMMGDGDDTAKRRGSFINGNGEGVRGTGIQIEGFDSFFKIILSDHQSVVNVIAGMGRANGHG